MGERRAEHRARQAGEAPQHDPWRHSAETGLHGDVGQRSEDQPESEADTERGRTDMPSMKNKATMVATSAAAEGKNEALRDGIEVAAFPGEKRTERHGSQKRHHQWSEGHVEERRADRDLVAGDSLDQQRVKRTDQNCRGGGRQKKIVEDQRAFPGDRVEQASGRQRRSPPGEKRQRPADEDHQDGEDEHAAGRIGGEGMDGGEHPGAHQKRAEKRERECQDRQKQRPDLQGRPLFHDDGGMQKRCSGKPRHE